MQKLTHTSIEEEPIGFFHPVFNLLYFLKVHFEFLLAADGASQFDPLKIHFHFRVSLRRRRRPSLAVSTAAAPPPPRSVLLVDYGRSLLSLCQLYCFNIIRSGMIANNTFFSLGPVLIRANRTGPVLGPRVQFISIIVFLARINRKGDRPWARPWGLRRLRGAPGPALGQALGASDGPRPVQVRAHVAWPLVCVLHAVRRLNPRSGTGVRAYQRAASSFGAGRIPVSAHIARTALKWIFCNNCSTGSLGTTHRTLDCRWPVFIRTIFTSPLNSTFWHCALLEVSYVRQEAWF